MTEEWTFPYEAVLHEVAPELHEAQVAWLEQLESLTHLDRRTHELIRMVCLAIARNPEGIARHAQFAAEAGASWPEIVEALLLTQPAFGVLVAASALEHARRGYERAGEVETDD